MKFERFKVWAVRVPARDDIVADAGEELPAWPQMPIYLVQGETDTGILALGESARGESYESVERTLREFLHVDHSTFTPASVWSTSQLPNSLPAPAPLPSWQNVAGRSYSILESLWLDSMGKAAGVPACQLLGGAVRDRVEVDFWANKPDLQGLKKLVGEACDLSLGGIKLKSSAGGATALAVSEIAADTPSGFHFTIDPMCSWRSFRESRHLFAKLSRTGRDIRIEDPFPHDSVSEWRRARAAFPELTFAWHARDEQSLRMTLTEDIADLINLSVSGAYEVLNLTPLVEFAGKDFWVGSSLELGVQQHLRLHAASAARRCVLPCDLQSTWVRASQLIASPMEFEKGSALVPKIPGLGVNLDMSAIKSFSIREFDVF